MVLQLVKRDAPVRIKSDNLAVDERISWQSCMPLESFAQCEFDVIHSFTLDKLTAEMITLT
jgi:hypothetical protein